MVGFLTRAHYLLTRLEYAISLNAKPYVQGRAGEASVSTLRSFLQDRLTFFHCNKHEELACGSMCGTLLVRRIPYPRHEVVHVGDLLLLKDPEDEKNHLVRRLAAVEGWEMESTDKNDEPFVLEDDQCWVLAENKALKPKEAYDSRTFGPVAMSSFVGRVVYCLRTAADHGPVENSPTSKRLDSSVLEVELDVDAMAKHNKA